MSALVQLVSDSEAESTAQLVDEIHAALGHLLPNMLAYAPPLNVLNRFLTAVERAHARGRDVGEVKSVVADLGAEHLEWSRAARAGIVSCAGEVIPHGAHIFTFTLSETVMTTLQKVWEDGKRFRVSVTESRPNDDGFVTARRLSEMGVPVTASIDACLAELIATSDLMLSGVEAILADGSAICKSGTYLAALAAREVGIPIFILADTMKFDVTTRFGIEHQLAPLSREDLPALMDDTDVAIAGHFFDRTPAKLIRAVITERGVLSPTACTQVMTGMPVSEVLVQKLRARDS